MKKLYSIMADMAITSSAAFASAPVYVADAVPEDIAEKPALAEQICRKTPFLKAPDSGTWKVIGKGTYADQLVADAYGMYEAGSQWEISIEQNTDNPGWYRTIPYNKNWPMYGFWGILDDDQYLYINATDPDRVYCDDFNAFGNLYFFQVVPENEKGAEQIAAGAKPVYGTLKDNVISFPAGSHIYAYTGQVSGDEILETVNTDGLLKIALPGGKLGDLWEDVGQGTFVDGVMGSMFAGGVTTELTVQIQRHTSKDGLYRMVDPWKKLYGSDEVLEFDTSNPDCVLIKEQPVGIKESTMGSVYVFSHSHNFVTLNGYTPQQYISEYPERNITLKDGVVTIPENGCVFFFPDTDASHFYTAKTPKVSTITLPGAGIDSPVVEDTDAPAEYYNLQGVRVQGDLAPGIYICRCGQTSTKVMIR